MLLGCMKWGKAQMLLEVPAEKSCIYEKGDRIAWCEGCYGVVVAKVMGWIIITTDDGCDRMGSEKMFLATEQQLQDRGVVWK